MLKYAQIDDNGLCIGITFPSGEINAPHMIHLTDETDVQLGDIYDGETWTRPEPEPIPESESTPDQQRIAQLEDESAMLAIELVDTQIRLDQSEAEHAALLFELVDKGVL